MIRSLEIFSGAGGLAKGIELAGAHHLGFVEWNSDACDSLRKNYPAEIVHHTDIRQVNFSDFGEVDFIAGGPPCQPFSLGGKAKGYNDERDMFPHAVAAIRSRMPKAFMFENVKGLLRPCFSDYFRFIILQLTYPEIKLTGKNWEEDLQKFEQIDKAGTYRGVKYDVRYKLVNAADYGVPQKRERVIIVGIKSELGLKWDFPAPTHSKEALLWSKYVTGDYWHKHNVDYAPTEETEIIRQRLIKSCNFKKPKEQPWVTIRDALKGIPDPITTDDYAPDHIFRDGAREYAGHSGSEIDEPSKTIKAGAHGVPGGENMIKFTDGSVRYLTVLEAKRIQTFPDNYVVIGAWSEAMRQLGNAVPVRLAHTIASSLFKTVFTRAKKHS